MSKVIVLMGIKHCGKSTQGRLLSKYYNFPFYDTDDVITSLTGKSPREIYSQQGAEAFIKAEADACAYLTGQNTDLVIATGGGICNNDRALSYLREMGSFVFLNVEEEIACNRIIKEIVTEKDGTFSNLPAYIKKENPHTIDDVRAVFHNFYTDRVKKYKALCDIEVCVGSAASDVNMLLIVKALTE